MKPWDCAASAEDFRPEKPSDRASCSFDLMKVSIRRGVGEVAPAAVAVLEVFGVVGDGRAVGAFIHVGAGGVSGQD
mgnify:CR=1 FL=1